MPLVTHPLLDLWLDLNGALGDAAAAVITSGVRALRRKKRRSFAVRRLGPDTPM